MHASSHLTCCALTRGVRAVTGLVALGAAVAQATAQPAPDKRMQQVMDRVEFTHATWGMEFYDLGTKKTLFAVNRDRLFVPGSTTSATSRMRSPAWPPAWA